MTVLWRYFLKAWCLFGFRSLLGQTDVVVSMTTYGSRLDDVAASLASIARGSLRPRRMVLWLADEDFTRPRPASLRALSRRGLEIASCADYLSHKKYFPFVMTQAIDSPLVTADDDVVYPRNWLRGLHEEFRNDESYIYCYRALRIGTQDGHITPYMQWGDAARLTAGPRTFATGVGGVLYPPKFLKALRARGDAFKTVAPYADDVWLHHTALTTDFTVMQIVEEPQDYRALRNGVSDSLASVNVAQGRNDRQVAQTYSLYDIGLLESDPHGPPTARVIRK